MIEAGTNGKGDTGLVCVCSFLHMPPPNARPAYPQDILTIPLALSNIVQYRALFSQLGPQSARMFV